MSEFSPIPISERLVNAGNAERIVRLANIPEFQQHIAPVYERLRQVPPESPSTEGIKAWVKETDARLDWISTFPGAADFSETERNTAFAVVLKAFASARLRDSTVRRTTP